MCVQSQPLHAAAIGKIARSVQAIAASVWSVTDSVYSRYREGFRIHVGYCSLCAVCVSVMCAIEAYAWSVADAMGDVAGAR